MISLYIYVCHETGRTVSIQVTWDRSLDMTHSPVGPGDLGTVCVCLSGSCLGTNY